MKGKELESRLKKSIFIDNFKLNAKKEPLFSVVEYEDDIISDNKIHKIVFEGELEQTLNKKSQVWEIISSCRKILKCTNKEIVKN